MNRCRTFLRNTQVFLLRGAQLIQLCLRPGSQKYAGARRRHSSSNENVVFFGHRESQHENLVGFEQPSYRSDRLDKVFESSDERGLLHATIRGTSANVGDPRATRFAALQIRRRNAVSLKSIPSARMNGDEIRKRVILSLRLTKR
jgi:hypothetical protein